MPSATIHPLLYTRFKPAINQICLVLAFVLAVVIAEQSLSVSNAKQTIPHLDKLVHFLAYGGLGVLALPGLPRMKPLVVIIGLGLMGAVLEIGQGVMGLGRSADVLDAFSNLGGALMALLFWWLVTKVLK